MGFVLPGILIAPLLPVMTVPWLMSHKSFLDWGMDCAGDRPEKQANMIKMRLQVRQITPLNPESKLCALILKNL